MQNYVLWKSGDTDGDRKRAKLNWKVRLLLSTVVYEDEVESSVNRQLLGFLATWWLSYRFNCKIRYLDKILVFLLSKFKSYTLKHENARKL